MMKSYQYLIIYPAGAGERERLLCRRPTCQAAASERERAALAPPLSLLLLSVQSRASKAAATASLASSETIVNKTFTVG